MFGTSRKSITAHHRLKSAAAVAGVLTVGLLAVAPSASAVGTASTGTSQTDVAPAGAAPEVYAGFEDFSRLVGANAKVSMLQVPAGTYSITAKVTAASNNGSNFDVTCGLTAGSNFDVSTVSLTPSARSQTIALTVVNKFTSGGLIKMGCSNSSSVGDANLSFKKITATTVNSIVSNKPLL